MILNSVKNILVPLDLSETSLNALQTAIALAKKHDARIHLLFVDENLTTLSQAQTDPAGFDHGNQDVLFALSSSIKHANKVLPTVIVEKGCVVEVILKVSLAVQSDVIVLGSHGASGFRDDYIGTTAYNVIKYAACPVLTIPPKRRFTSFRKVLFPIRPVSGAMSPYYVASPFLAPGSMVDVLGLSYLNIEKETTLLDKIVREIGDVVTDDKVNMKTFWGSGHSIANDILEFAQQNNSDLIVLTNALDAIPKSNFIGPYAQKVIHSSKVPLLSIKKIGIQAPAPKLQGDYSNM
jgi:nucleotide-binding universal stress UspA family protein